VFLHFTEAVPWLRRLGAGLSQRNPAFALGSVHVGFVVDSVLLGQVFLRVLRFFFFNNIPPWLSILIYHLGVSNRLLGDRSLETQACPVDMNLHYIEILQPEIGPPHFPYTPQQNSEKGHISTPPAWLKPAIPVCELSMTLHCPDVGAGSRSFITTVIDTAAPNTSI
jgi:hypothetical protein